ncbi:hypothetical protein KYG33_11255 [Chryseobacterium sp. D764]|jgi:hypothetical protein|uniref:hypothetical protein n=1 Tax=unclassified Chryseobacterium TaxID=2593645 RepID=UPI001C59AB07|nr:hypothetical protein [Chryseobacterium sp. D764]QXU47406.1 hypothetical protein KYG33_11255 [Chryseobacterium sp. D764]
MKTKILLLFLLGWVGIVFGQEKINKNKIDEKSQFIFDYLTTTKGVDCTKDGIKLEGIEELNMPTNAIFTIEKENDDGSFVIKFSIWKSKDHLEDNLTYYYKQVGKNTKILDAIKTEEFDLKTGKAVKKNIVDSESNVINVTERFFLVKKDDLLLNGSVYNLPKYEFVFGTISYLARIRPSVKDIPSYWSTDLNLGFAYGIKRNFNKNWGIAALGGISFSKAKIDSLSTSPSIDKSIEKISLSPTLNILCNYKNFFIGIGAGFDWINLDDEESKKWVYNKKIFYAIGIGMNLFSSSTSDTPKATNSP